MNTKPYTKSEVYLSGALAAKATASSGEVLFTAENADIQAFLGDYAKEIYAKDPEKIKRKNGGRGMLLSLKSNSALKYVSNILESKDSAELFKQKCQGCQAAFLRGVFLACGRASDPAVQYSLEFSVGERAPLFMRLFEELGLTPRLAVRRSERVIYFRAGSEIEDFFALAGMNNTVFSLINAKINSEIRNNANRIANCETNNIGKAVNASMKHINAINDLIEANMLSSLPDELERTARLRVQHTDLSLSQLANISVPSITKSGLSHRLNKILEIAEQKLGKKYT